MKPSSADAAGPAPSVDAHADAVHAQFNPQAQAYLTSAVHAQGPDLHAAAKLVAHHVAPGAVALDLGCGAGHLSYALAPHVARVVSVDASDAMLGTVADTAATRGLTQIATQQAQAEALPFDNHSFDLIATRYSAHHWTRLPQAMAEMVRVAKPWAWVLIIDVEGDVHPLVDTHLQTLELLRDRSHVRDLSEPEWRGQCASVGIQLFEHRRFPLRLEFSSWVQRMRTPPDKVAMLRTIQLEAPAEVQRALAIEPDGSFTVQTGLYWGRVAHG